MQLSMQRLVLALIATSACLLVVPVSGRADGRWHVALDTSFYTDTDNVIVVTPQTSVRHSFDEDGSEVHARVNIDVVTAASADVVSQATQRFTEERYEAVLGGAWAVDRWVPSLSYRVSSEPDYFSNSVRAELLARLGGDTTLAIGYGPTYDVISRTDTPSAAWSRTLWSHDANASLTQVLSPEALVRGVYTLTVQDGYLAKPYRFVPLFDAAGIAAARASGQPLDADTFDRFRSPERPEEVVPDLRVGHAFAVRGLVYADAIDGSVRLDYQLYFDSWGIVAHMLEPAVYFGLGEEWLLQVYTRLYVQSAASFWQREYVVERGQYPRYRTLDRELSTYASATVGARIEWAPSEWAAYVDTSGMYTQFAEALVLDDRLALVTQIGVRWSP